MSTSDDRKKRFHDQLEYSKEKSRLRYGYAVVLTKAPGRAAYTVFSDGAVFRGNFSNFVYATTGIITKRFRNTHERVYGWRRKMIILACFPHFMVD